MANQALVPAYPTLLKTCQDLYRKAYQAARKQVLEFYWDIGSEILKALGDEKGAYGEATVLKLAEDLNLGKSTLYHSMALATKFQRSEISPQLTWAHYCALLPLPTEMAKTLAKKAEDKDMPVRVLKAEIVKVKEKRYADKPARFAGARLATALNPLSGIPAVSVLKDLGVKEIDEVSHGRILKRIEAAEEKIKEIREFVGGLKVVSAPERKGMAAKKEERRKRGKKAGA